MLSHLEHQQQIYADLLIKIGVNLQPGQSMHISAEIEHRDFVHKVVSAAYQAGARYVTVDWEDSRLAKSRLLHSDAAYLDFFPEYEVARYKQMQEEGWARLSLVGPEFPHIYDDVDPALLLRISATRRQRLKFYAQATMANQFQWCVAAVPTRAWACKIFPELSEVEALEHLWGVLLRMCRTDLADPVQAWDEHDQRLEQVVKFMDRYQIRAIRYLDTTLAEDGKPSTDLTVGLTERPIWIGASSTTPQGVRFFANIPTEEVFSTPHNQQTEGWVRTSKPAFPLEREVNNVYFRFEQGLLVEYHAEIGCSVLDQFFQISGTKRLGELSLVDVRSPVNQSNLLFYETLFDENTVCHIAFGNSYPEGIENGMEMSEEELYSAGANSSEGHVDFMIGTPTMDVLGICADGREIVIMKNGQFTSDVIEGPSSE